MLHLLESHPLVSAVCGLVFKGTPRGSVACKKLLRCTSFWHYISCKMSSAPCRRCLTMILTFPPHACWSWNVFSFSQPRKSSRGAEKLYKDQFVPQQLKRISLPAMISLLSWDACIVSCSWKYKKEKWFWESWTQHVTCFFHRKRSE